MSEVQEEWERKQEYSPKLKLLMSHSFENRRIWTRSKSMQEMVDGFPCFQEGNFVLDELYALRSTGQESSIKNTIQENIATLMEKVQSLPKGTKIQQPTGDLEVDNLLKLEEKVAIRKGKGTKSKSIISVMKVETVDIDEASAFAQEKKKPLAMKIIICDGNYKAAYVVGENIVIKHLGSVWEAVIVLLGAYYIGDLEYPSIYGQFLGLLQQYILEDPYTLSKGTNFITLYKSLKVAK